MQWVAGRKEGWQPHQGLSVSWPPQSPAAPSVRAFAHDPAAGSTLPAQVVHPKGVRKHMGEAMHVKGDASEPQHGTPTYHQLLRVDRHGPG